ILTIGVVSLLFLSIFGIWNYRQTSLAVSQGDSTGIMPRWAGLSVFISGTFAAVSIWLLSPAYVFPSARTVLEAYGYEPAVVENELATMRLTLALFPATVALQGMCVFYWETFAAFLERLPHVKMVCSLSPSIFVISILIVPIVFVRLIALLGVPF